MCTILAILQPLIDLMKSDLFTILIVPGGGVAGAYIQRSFIIHWNWPGKKWFWPWYGFWWGLSKEEMFPGGKPQNLQNTATGPKARPGRENIPEPGQVQDFSTRAICRKLEAQKRQVRECTPLMVAVLLAFAQAHPPFSRARLMVLVRFFQHTCGWQGAEPGQGKSLVKAALIHPRPLTELLADCERTLNHDCRLQLVDLIYQLVWTRDAPILAELKLARETGRKLGLFTTELRGLEAKYRFRENQQEGHRGEANQERLPQNNPGLPTSSAGF